MELAPGRVLRSAGRTTGPLPNFLLIGAMKAGTTSMYHYLQAHPQVYMPRFKAPEFFAGKALSARGIDWYRRQFAGAGPEAVAIGEASNVYTKYPKYPGVPRPHRRGHPGREAPVHRARADLAHPLALRHAGRSRDPSRCRSVEAVATNPIYLDYSRYAMQLEQYLEHFDRDQLLVITAEALRDDREEVMRTVYGFLGVDCGDQSTRP